MTRPLLKWVYDKFKGKCHYCGIETGLGSRYLGDKIRATIDHKIPKSAGIGAGLDNLLLACSGCNSRKGSKPYRIFLKQIREEKKKDINT